MAVKFCFYLSMLKIKIQHAWMKPSFICWLYCKNARCMKRSTVNLECWSFSHKITSQRPDSYHHLIPAFNISTDENGGKMFKVALKNEHAVYRYSGLHLVMKIVK